MLFLLQEGPANTTDYMIAGYAIIFGVMLIYLVSLIVRRRNLHQDLEVLRELEEEDGLDGPPAAVHPVEPRSASSEMLGNNK